MTQNLYHLFQCITPPHTSVLAFSLRCVVSHKATFLTTVLYFSVISVARDISVAHDTQISFSGLTPLGSRWFGHLWSSKEMEKGSPWAEPLRAAAWAASRPHRGVRVGEPSACTCTGSSSLPALHPRVLSTHTPGNGTQSGAHRPSTPLPLNCCSAITF